MKRAALIFIFSLSIFSFTNAQLPDGSMAPDFTLTDTDGNSHNLYDYLNDGMTVFIDFFAAWCPPCWNYHQSHALENLYTTYGNEIMVFAIEADGSTPYDAVFGAGNSIGDWTVGVSYPIFSPTGGALSVVSDYAVNFYPTIYGVCSDGTIYEVGQQSMQGQYNFHINTCAEFDVSIDLVENENCYQSLDGAIYLSVSDPNQSYTYEWSNGSNTQDLINVGAGNYSCTVTSVNSGYEVYLYDIPVIGPDSPLEVINEFVTDATCYEGNSGEITVSVFGSTPPYTFFWSNGDTGETVSDLEAGTYEVTVMDVNDCILISEYTVEEPEQLESEVLTAPATCGDDNGEISVMSSGGTGPYLYDIGNGPTDTATFSLLQPGEYTLLVTDANECSEYIDLTISDIPSPTFSINEPAQISCDDPMVILQTDLTEPDPNFMYTWTTQDGSIINSSDSSIVEVNAPGTYYLTIMDIQYGCSTTDSIEVQGDNDIPLIEIEGNYQIDCVNSLSQLSAEAMGDGEFTYSWTDSNGNAISNEQQISFSQDGLYFLTVVNQTTGCEVVREIHINENMESPEFNLQYAGPITCQNEETVLNLELDLENYQATLLNHQGAFISDFDQNIIITEGGLFYVTITNLENGCSSTKEILIDDQREIPNGEFNYEIIRGHLLLQVDNVLNQPDVEYKWVGCGGLSLFGSSQDIEIDLDRLPCVVCLTASNDCGQNVKCQRIELPTTLEGDVDGSISKQKDRINPFDQLNIFPNPAREFIYIETGSRLLHISIFNSDGKLVKETLLEEIGKHKISTASLNSGIYFLRISHEEKTTVSRILIHKNSLGIKLN
jgi:thiol-disulfide isomerase/thioredoxin